MPERVIKQPDGKYAIWSSEVDDFVVYDATADEIDSYVVIKAIEKAQQEAAHMIANAEFTSDRVFSENLDLRNELHGKVDKEDLEFTQWISRWESEENDSC